MAEALDSHKSLFSAFPIAGPCFFFFFLACVILLILPGCFQHLHGGPTCVCARIFKSSARLLGRQHVWNAKKRNKELIVGWVKHQDGSEPTSESVIKSPQWWLLEILSVCERSWADRFRERCFFVTRGSEDDPSGTCSLNAVLGSHLLSS